MSADHGGIKNYCTPIFHLSETSDEGQSPGDYRSPEDTRFPKDNCRKESPTLRTEDPRQKTYAYRNAGVISRMHGSPRPFFPENAQSPSYLSQSDAQNMSNTGPKRFDKIFPGDDWNQGNSATLAGLNTFTDKDKITAMNANNRHLDTEMADQSANSRGPTPQSSSSSYNHSSSNTSYSPSQAHDEDQAASGTSGGGNYMPGFAPPSHSTIFTGEGVKRAKSPSAQQQDDPFKIPAGWDMGTGMTPGPGMTPGSLTGMTPDGGWEKLMDSMGWETGKIG